MAKITIQRGDSARIQIILPVDKMADVEDVICYVGASLVFKQSDDTLIATTDPNIFYIDLKSKVTNTLAGENELAIAVDYSDLGVKKTPKSENLIIVVENNVNVFSNPSVSDLILATVNVTINETTISSDSCIASYVVVNSGGGGGIPDAPNDANAYVRSGLSWVIGYTKTAIDNLLGNKVDKVTGKSLIDDTEISRLASMTAIFTTALKTAYDGAVSWITTNGTNLINHLSNISNPHNVTKSQVGLGNVDNTSDIDKPISTATQNVLDLKLDKVSTAGVERAYIINADGSQGTKATSELKEVLEFANLAAFPATGESGKIYLALDTNKTYRWSGSAYVQIGGGTDATKLPLAGGTMSGAINTQNLLPATTATYTLGDATHYYSNAYTTRQYLNSTAYLDGGTEGAVGITGNVGIGTTTPAHYLDVSKTVNSRTAYGINSTMTASTLQSDVASTGNDETFTNSHYAWKFVASDAHTVGSISVRLKKVGTVTNTTDTIQLKIFSDNAGTPGTLLLTTDNIKMVTLTTSYVEYLFGGDMTLVNGTTYWIAVRKSAAVTGGGSIAIDRNGTALTTCNTATPVSGDWTVNAGQGRYAVYGRSPIGIRGISTNSQGVYGTSTNSNGVYGTSTNSQGVYGISTNNVGVQGTSTNSYGVYGTSTNSQGVYGTSTNNVGVYGTSTNAQGVYGTSTNSHGVFGESTNNVGVYGKSTNSYGVNGNSTNSYGAFLTQSGTLTAANSSNAALVRRNGVTNSTGSLNYSGNVLQITDNPTGTGTVSGALISGSLSVAADGSGTTERIRFDPRVSNGASAVAHMLDTGNALSTAGALLLDVRNNGVSKFKVDYAGKITATSISCSPTISSGTSAPATTPTKVGDMFVDTTGKKIYVATGVSSSGDWTILN